jgi:DNA-3-methyladenine glycosylase
VNGKREKFSTKNLPADSADARLSGFRAVLPKIAKEMFSYKHRTTMRKNPSSLPTTVIAGVDFGRPSLEVAQALIGVTVLIDGVGGVIVETEAYDHLDPASHSFGGPTPRNAAMFGPPAHAYVYRSYGMHWCLNFVCEQAGHGAGVLLRALEPTVGLERMRERRGALADRLLCAGPGRLCQALGVTHALNGRPLAAPPFTLLPAPPGVRVWTGPRIGISKAMDQPWRFGMAESRWFSKPFPLSSR